MSVLIIHKRNAKSKSCWKFDQIFYTNKDLHFTQSQISWNICGEKCSYFKWWWDRHKKIEIIPFFLLIVYKEKLTKLNSGQFQDFSSQHNQYSQQITCESVQIKQQLNKPSHHQINISPAISTQ